MRKWTCMTISFYFRRSPVIFFSSSKSYWTLNLPSPKQTYSHESGETQRSDGRHVHKMKDCSKYRCEASLVKQVTKLQLWQRLCGSTPLANGLASSSGSDPARCTYGTECRIDIKDTSLWLCWANPEETAVRFRLRAKSFLYTFFLHMILSTCHPTFVSQHTYYSSHLHIYRQMLACVPELICTEQSGLKIFIQ